MASSQNAESKVATAAPRFVSCVRHLSHPSRTAVLQSCRNSGAAQPIRTRISGVVKLHPIIDKSGSIQELTVVSGHPLLIPAAMEAVKTWRYKPTLLNTEPVEVDTTIDVIFSLNQ